MSTDIVRREENAFELGKVFAESGMFPNTRKASEAIVKIIAGREFGLGPMAAMNGIHMVDGKPTLAANLIAGQIKRHPRYDYKVLHREADGCSLEFFENGQSVGVMNWTERDAKAAGLLRKQNWQKYPRDMYFARCLTAGARTYCPDVLGGSPVYTAEELGADDAVSAQEPVSGPSVDDRRYGVNPEACEPEIADAEIVPDDPSEERVNAQTLDTLRESFKKSGKTDDDLAWCLLSVGVTSLPESPSKKDIGEAMRSLTVVQAVKLDELLSGEAS